MTKKCKSFEEKLKELEEIASRLDDPSCPLEESLKLFEKGVSLSRELNSELNEAKLKVMKLLEDGKKEDVSTIFNEEENKDI